MPFYFWYDARQHEPIGTFSAELREQHFITCCENMSHDEAVGAYEAQKKAYEAQQEQKRIQLHEHYVARAGGKPNFVMSVAQAKAYVRLRAADSLQAAFETYENVLRKGSNAPLKDQLSVAEEILKRAVGPAQVVNAVPNVQALTELAPVDAVDSVLRSFAAGAVDEKFVATLLGILGAKVNALAAEQALDKKSAQKVSDRIQKPPPGKVV
ncbi:hypothetical protein RB623_06825 [Mesorhizobium sp. LHD-90]|uniref:hypothetical protein n=1 Tax=Mesorhizobium sp. LHD-90 TaxID=3071414 RepID=UPI0027E0324C|nr:hypothetical protein [Mesorhizobium sp. LHD-90]MDQ6433764.1 hypothetical protein [Mesorhizobium sp. LHD-90]